MCSGKNCFKWQCVHFSRRISGHTRRIKPLCLLLYSTLNIKCSPFLNVTPAYTYWCCTSRTIKEMYYSTMVNIKCWLYIRNLKLSVITCQICMNLWTSGDPVDFLSLFRKRGPMLLWCYLSAFHLDSLIVCLFI